ncbi:T9SS type A sorting domain-containing protein [Chryseobacterium sp.]|uniref:T9SS type A sorting domain-containing protein n=1 Tax=Chryseobacterium sp. TaxID=1871047 RepID=UPI00321C087E
MRLLLIVFCNMIVANLYSQDKYIKDPNFNAAFQTNKHFIDGKEVITTLTQPDGKILVVYKNYEYTLNVGDITKIVRINPDFTLDTSYIGGNFDGTVNSISLQNDGKIVAVGSFTKYNNVTEKNMIRLNGDGTKDNTFNIGTGFGYEMYDTNRSVRKVMVLNGGKILVSGNFLSYNGISTKYVVKLNSDGSLDTAFNFLPTFPNDVIDFGLQQNGKIVAINKNRVWRYNSDGSHDTSFYTHDDNTFSGDIKTIALADDDKIYLGGKFKLSESRQYITRLNADGTMDGSFLPKRFYTMAYENADHNGVFALLPQTGGKVIVAGNFRKYGDNWVGGIIRLNNDGNMDPSFLGRISSIRYESSGEVIQHLRFDNDGDIIAGGRIKLYNEISANNIVKFSATDGEVNMSFRNICKGFDRAPNKVVVQPDGKMLVSGEFSSYNGITRDKIIRLNPDGSVDESFSADAYLYLSSGIYPFDIHLQTDGKIVLLTGNVIQTSYFGAFGGAVIRLNQNGSLDTSFFSLVGNDIGLDGQARQFIVKDDGKIIVPNMYKHNTILLPNQGIVALDTDGNLDNSIVYQKPYSSILWLKLLPDNKILLSGNNSGGAIQRGLGRLLPNGQIDPTFVMAPSFNNNRDFFPTSDGKILALERNSSFHKISRYNNDGTVDLSFVPPTYPMVGTELMYQPLEFENNGKFLTSVPNGFDSRSLVRHNANGTYDTTFDIGTGFTISHTKYYGEIVSEIKKHGNGFVVAGEFDYFDGQYTKGIARLIPQSLLGTKETKTAKKNLIYPNPTTGIINVRTEGFNQYQIMDSLGRVVINSKELTSTIDVSDLPKGVYYIHLNGSKEKSVEKFIKK